jgi:NAD+ synthase
VEAPLERGNIAARCRMIVLYNLAKKRNYIVAGTSNKSEMMTGYFTKFGDGACDLTPLANLYKTEVRQIASLIGVPQEIIDKPPSAGFWEGQTDESEMGISYGELDVILRDLEAGLDDNSIARDAKLTVDEVVRMRELVASMEHKRHLPLRPDTVSRK